MLLNVASEKLGKKDVVKIENKVVSEEEASKIALIAPDATLNIIKNWKVVEKNLKREKRGAGKVTVSIAMADRRTMTFYQPRKSLCQL